MPEFARGLGASILQLHSSEYRNPGQLRPGPVIAVGVGNSGAEIALELSRTRPTILAGTPSGELPVRHGRTAARFVLPAMRFAGLHILTLGTPVGRTVLAKAGSKGTPLMRTRTADLEAAGVLRVARVTGTRDGKPVVTGGDVLDVANVIWCTGYRDDLRWMDVPAFDDEGRLVQRHGVVTAVPGLYVLGQEGMHSVMSATLPGAVSDAAFLARQMGASRRASEPKPRSLRPVATVVRRHLAPDISGRRDGRECRGRLFTAAPPALRGAVACRAYCDARPDVFTPTQHWSPSCRCPEPRNSWGSPRSRWPSSRRLPPRLRPLPDRRMPRRTSRSASP
ncbi:hypothetical protein GCM10023152_08810 [Agromyces bauzanensis]|uniref:FAD/NAD(P)-binding domain-containing protein n=1 Tax=Agromyces bauzanensis TaxID=1308924 RepID=A0A917PQM4_9MICO|nr:hypothetical protein GCM10011372_28120 [Agromyces bauzanensis]